jgi:hypothetical protein
VKGAAIVLVFAVVGVHEDVRLGVLVRVEKPKVSKGLPKFVFEFCAARGEVFNEGLGGRLAGEGKDNSLSIGKSVYGGAGHTSPVQLDMVLIATRGFFWW